MNERIEQLAEQCWEPRQYGPSWFNSKNGPSWFNSKKFAELIVRECMTTILKESKWYWDKDEFESSNAIQNAARRLKEHFGVE